MRIKMFYKQEFFNTRIQEAENLYFYKHVIADIYLYFCMEVHKVY